LMKTAFLFPGQGAQYAGMGYDFYQSHSQARSVFEQTEKVLGSDFLEVIFSGPEEKLQQTEYTQPAILAVSMAIFRVLEDMGLKASGLAGLSLGEYSALVAAGSISFEEALPLVQKRGIYMQEAVPAGEGTMVAIMGLSHDTVEQICLKAQSKGLVAPANYNCPGQIVISGRTPAVKLAVELAGNAGAKKVSELKVSAPFHCALLQPVEEQLARELEKITIKKPQVPVVFNVTAAYSEDPGEIKNNLIKQASSPILWEQSVHTLLDSGIDTFIGLGPGTSLVRLMKRIAPEKTAYAVKDTASAEKINKS